LKRARGGLVPVAAGKGIEHPFATRKTELQRSFLQHPVDAPFTQEQIEYVAADATVTALLYLPMVEEMTINNVLIPVLTIEMPALIDVVDMAWAGLRQGRQRTPIALQPAQIELKECLQRPRDDYGVAGLEPAAVLTFAERAGIKEYLRTLRTKS